MRKKKTLWVWLIVLLLVSAAAAAAVIGLRKADEQQPVAVSPPPSTKPTGVGARGRIEPEDGILVVAAPYTGGNPTLIKELRVKEGDWLTAGQVVAVLHGWTVWETDLRQREADVEVARRKLAQVQAGTKTADIDAQKMEIARWESEFEIATSEYRRAEGLRKEDIISTSDLEQKRLLVERNRRTLDAARERLTSLKEIRKEDVDVLAAELSSSLAQVERARAELDQMVVKAPVNGRVLRILAHAGEEGSKGILELGRTDRMFVIAEVYESDISRVRVGQTARISGELVPEEISGAVTEISSRVTKSELLSLVPTDYSDTRVVNVKIRLEHGAKVAKLIHGKVNVVIQP